MKKLLGVALLGALVASPAQAQEVMCGTTEGGGFQVCVLAAFEVTGATDNVLNMYVFNGPFATAGDPNDISAITGVAVGLPGSYTANSLTVSYFTAGNIVGTDISSFWQIGTTITPGPPITADFTGSTIANDGISTCAGPVDGQTRWKTCDRDGTVFGSGWDYVLFSWTLAQTIQNTDFADLGWGFRGMSVGNTADDSILCVSDTEVITSNKLCEVDTFDDGQGNVVPEPATMTLLATGLAGMAAARRRRKNNA